MKENLIVKIDEIEMDMLTSKEELSEINGGKSGILETILESMGIELDNNCGAGGCNGNCGCTHN